MRNLPPLERLRRPPVFCSGVDIVRQAVTSPGSDAYAATFGTIAAIASLVSGADAADCAWSVAPFNARRSADADVQELKSSGPVIGRTNGNLSPTTVSSKLSTTPMSKMQTPGEDCTNLRLTENEWRVLRSTDFTHGASLDGTNLWYQ